MKRDISSEAKAQGAFAGLWPRLKAFGLDYLVISVYLITLTVVGLFLNMLAPAVSKAALSSQYYGELSGFFLLTLPVSLYFALSEALPRQATWGKRRIGLKVVQIKDGKPLSLARSLARTALKFIPWELSHTSVWYIRFHPESPWPLFTIGISIVCILVVLNVLSLTVSHKHQTLYDMIAGTAVEKVALVQ